MREPGLGCWEGTWQHSSLDPVLILGNPSRAHSCLARGSSVGEWKREEDLLLSAWEQAGQWAQFNLDSCGWARDYLHLTDSLVLLLIHVLATMNQWFKHKMKGKHRYRRWICSFLPGRISLAVLLETESEATSKPADNQQFYSLTFAKSSGSFLNI